MLAVRRGGRMAKVEIVDLREKVELIRQQPRLLASPEIDKGTVPTYTQICEWMQKIGGTPTVLDKGDLAKAMNENRLPGGHLRSFLLAFFDPQTAPANIDLAAQMDLLAAPVDVFRALVRLRGGVCPGLPGSYWESFFKRRIYLADEAGQSKVTLLRLEKQRRFSSPDLDRVLPMGAPDPFPQPDEPRDVVSIGEKIGFRIALDQALEKRGPTCHLRVVQEVEVQGQLVFLPLVPFPGQLGKKMPPTYLPAAHVTIPADTALDALWVPPKWGPRRRLIIVVTRHPLLLEGDPADESEPELTPSFMDLLAARLAEPGVEFTLMRYEYLAWPDQTK